MRKFSVFSRQLSVGSRCLDRSHNVPRSTLDSRPSTIHHQPLSLNSQPSTLNSSAGFTLIEVLVALGLSVVLLAAVYASINISYRLSTAGRDQMEQAQLVRALFDRIESDIRSVVWVKQEDVASSEQAAADEESEIAIESLSTDDAFTNASSGIYGDSQTLVLHISRPSRVVGQSLDQLTARSDVAAVNYFLAVRGSTGLSGLVAQAAHQGSLLDAPRLGTVTGLTRLEGDRLLVQQASESGDLETLATHARILASEVVSLSFEYWNGLEWSGTWDSTMENRLPAAIAITLGIDTSERDSDGVSTQSLADRIRTTSDVNEVTPAMYRHVVALPLSEPFVGELIE